jgi:hypothetical protein
MKKVLVQNKCRIMSENDSFKTPAFFESVGARFGKGKNHRAFKGISLRRFKSLV